MRNRSTYLTQPANMNFDEIFHLIADISLFFFTTFASTDLVPRLVERRDEISAEVFEDVVTALVIFGRFSFFPVHLPPHPREKDGEGRGGGREGAHSLVACLSHSTIDHTCTPFETEHRSYCR